MNRRSVVVTRSGQGRSQIHASKFGSVTALTSDQNPGGVAVQFADVPVGVGPPFHRHPAFDEVFIVLEGAVEFQTDDELHTARAGDLVFVPGEISHAPRAVEGNADGVARMIMLVTPARFENFFHEAGTLVRSGQGDHDSIAKLGRAYGIEFVDRPAVRVRH